MTTAERRALWRMSIEVFLRGMLFLPLRSPQVLKKRFDELCALYEKRCS